VQQRRIGLDPPADFQAVEAAGHHQVQQQQQQQQVGPQPGGQRQTRRAVACLVDLEVHQIQRDADDFAEVVLVVADKDFLDGCGLVVVPDRPRRTCEVLCRKPASASG
jgi:hypothetical protein